MELEIQQGGALAAAPTVQKKSRAALRRWQKILINTGLTLGVLWVGLQTWMLTAERDLRQAPDYPKENLSAIVGKDGLDEADYNTLLLQTGLGRPSVDYLREKGLTEAFGELQNAFFASPNVHCDKNTPVSAEEIIVDKAGKKVPGTKIVGLEDGDILVTSSCHTFGWRNGHSALVVDAKNGIVLESVVMGQNSSFQKVDRWSSYPAFMVLRLKGASAEKRREIAWAATQTLHDIPYGLTVGLLSQKFNPEGSAATHCAHLVWQAFMRFGYDLDSNGGPIVTPQDLSKSPLLELKQVYGYTIKS